MPNHIGDLNTRQLKFCQEYHTAPTPTEAARRAGYSFPKSEAVRLMDNPAVKAEIVRLRDENSMAAQLTDEWIIERLMKIASGDWGLVIQKLEENDYDLRCLTPDETYLVSEYIIDIYKAGRGDAARDVLRRKLKGAGISDKNDALKTLARIRGLFQDKLSVDVHEDVVQRLLAGRKRVGKGGTDDG